MGSANLDGVRVKLRRAEHHIGELRSLLDPVAETARQSVEREVDGLKVIYRITHVPTIDPDVSAIVGDVVHNLHSALDHLTWQLVILDGGQPNRYTTFPIYESSITAKGNPQTLGTSHNVVRNCSFRHADGKGRHRLLDDAERNMETPRWDRPK